MYGEFARRSMNTHTHITVQGSARRWTPTLPEDHLRLCSFQEVNNGKSGGSCRRHCGMNIGVASDEDDEDDDERIPVSWHKIERLYNISSQRREQSQTTS